MNAKLPALVYVPLTKSINFK